MAYERHYIDRRLHYVHQSTTRGVRDIENYATSQVTTESVEIYENTLMKRTSDLKHNINDQLDNLHHDIISRRPSKTDMNYTQKQEQYHAFLMHANDGMGSMQRLFSQLFSKLFEVVKTIVKWIVERVSQIVSAIVRIFATVILPLLVII